MDTKQAAWLLAGIGLLIALGAASYYFMQPVPSYPVSNEDDAAIRAMTAEFGTHFKEVSLLAPDAGAQIQAAYSAYTTPELIRKWQGDLQNAPGRLTSSPWPESLSVVSVTAVGKDTYQVEGNVIEVTSASPREPAAIYPITLTVTKAKDGRWVVSSYTKGAYSELPQRTTITGTWECLPHKEKGGYQTMECAFGIQTDDGKHYGVDSSLMARYPIDYPTGSRARVTGFLTPVEQLGSRQIYDIRGVIRATEIEQL